MARYRVKPGVPFAAMPRSVAELLPGLRGRAGSVLLLAFLQAPADGGGVWVYGNSREVAAVVGFSGTSIREAFALLLDLGIFVDYQPGSNADTTGRVRIAAHLWPYEPDCG